MGLRDAEHVDGATALKGPYLTVVVGHFRGTRARRRLDPPDAVAHRISHRIDSGNPAPLDEELGPVACAVVDTEHDRTVVWRDRFGRHLLQLVRLDEGWAVTTSPRDAALLSNQNPRWSHLAGYLRGVSTTTDTDVFRDLYRIRPGERVTFEGHRLVDRKRWWRPQRRRRSQNATDIRGILNRIGRHLGRRPHLLALSGGLDSATLAAFGTARHPRSIAFTFHDPSAPHRESEIASRLATRLGLRWRRFCIERHWPLSRVGDLRSPPALGPLGHPDVAWKLPCHRWLNTHSFDVPIVYGNGADELFWVPRRTWLETRWNRLDCGELRRAMSAFDVRTWLGTGIDAVFGSSTRRLRRRFARRRSPQTHLWNDSHHWIQASVVGDSPPEPGDACGRYDALRSWRLSTWRWERVMRSLAHQSRTQQRAILTPFLDAELWEAGLALSAGELVEDGLQKAPLRRATAGLVPEEDRLRPKIGGFDAVVERGLADRGASRLLSLFGQPRLAQWPGFHLSRFLAAYEAYRRGPDLSSHHQIRGSWPIWRTLSAELWLRRGSSVPAPTQAVQNISGRRRRV